MIPVKNFNGDEIIGFRRCGQRKVGSTRTRHLVFEYASVIRDNGNGMEYSFPHSQAYD